MTTYGISRYGPPNLYGPTRPVTVVPGGSALPTVANAYLIDPFTAVAVDYQSVLLTWTAPVSGTATPMTEFRLLSNRYGFPVDQDDGRILLDVATAPGTHFVDQNVVPGQVTYYAFYINTGTMWVRSGFTACLMPKDYDYASRLWSYLPAYLRDVQDGELTGDATGDAYLWQFLQVAGFAVNYLKTQYDFLFSNQNSPMKMSFSDLSRLAAQVGMPFSGEIPAYFLRKAVDNWAVVMRERGTLSGIAEHISLLSGYGADVQIARNVMLENDQSMPRDPRPADWSAGVPYHVGESVKWPVYPDWVVSQPYAVSNFVKYNGVNYSCIATGGQGVPPTGATTSGTYWAIAAGPYVYKCSAAITSLPGTAPPAVGAAGTTPTVSNANWTLVYDQDATTNTLAITGLVGGQSTWEVLGATAGSTTPKTAAVAAGTLAEGIGIRNPANFSNDFSQNTFRVENRSASVQDQWFRSLSRQASDVTAGSAVPDPQIVVEHGIPVPQPGQPWNAGTRYPTGAVVQHGGPNWLALRASTGATPPSPGVPVNANSDFEAGIAPWTAANGTVAQSAAFANFGTHSLALTPNGTSSSATARSELLPVIPLATYTAKAWVFINAGYAGANTGIVINWADAFGKPISTSAVAGIAIPAATWTPVSVTGVQAPANAATAQLILQVGGTPAATVVSFWDQVMLTESATPEWGPLGRDSRVPLTISAETSQNWSVASAEQFAISPFAEWYDNWGNLITRVFARTPTAGTPGGPSASNYAYDAFTGSANTPLHGRTPDTGSNTWFATEGSLMLDGNGNAIDPGVDTWCLGLLPGLPSTATYAVTFSAAPPDATTSAALAFWYTSYTNRWAATMNGLWYNNGGTWTQAAAYATNFQAGDRVYVVASQSTPSITVYRNVIGTHNATTGNGQVASITGTTAIPTAVTPGTTSEAGIMNEQV